VTIKKTIIIEDNVYKAVAIKRVLCDRGISVTDVVSTGDIGIEMIKREIERGMPYDLLVLDMHFKIFGEYNTRAGETVLDELKRQGINIPTVICSSHRYEIPEVAACIFYNERSRDLASDLGMVIDELNSIF
jgi:CheY-like chemotaxis protein